MNRKIILIIICAATLAIAVVAGIYYFLQNKGNIEEENNMSSTNSTGYAIEETPSADPALVGKWSCAENPQWYKVYYDDPDDEESYFWGKEWDETDEVQEEDLMYHGNGWFRWRKENNRLTELHTMDANDVLIPKLWFVKFLSVHMSNDSLVMTNAERKSQCYHFKRVQS